MTSQSGNPPTESLITLDRATYESWQQELATLRQENEQLRDELAACQKFHEVLTQQLSAELEAKFAQRIKALFEKVAELQAILDNSPAVIYVKDIQGRFLLTNHQFETLFHLTKEQTQGKSNHEIFPKELADAFWENDQQVLQAGTALRFEENALQDDGMHTYLSLKFPLFNAQGSAYAICGISTDITDRQQAEADRFRLAAIVESSDDAIISKSLDGMITSWNAGAERMFGYQAEEIVGQPICLLVPGDRLDEERQILEKLKRGERIEHFETIRNRKDGSLIDLSLTISPIKDATGNVIGASTIARDVSEQQAVLRERKRAEESLMLYKQAVESSSDAIGFSDPSGHHFYQNQAFSDLYECETPAAFNEMGGIPAVFSNPAVAQEIIQTIMAGQAWVGEVEQRSRSGRVMQTLIRAYAIRNDQGDVLGLVGATTDITERRREEQRAETQYAVTRILSEANHTSEAIPQILQVICDSLEWDFSEFWSVDDSANLLRWAETWHRPGRVRPEFMAATRSRTFAPGAGLPGQVWATGEPVWIIDVVHDANFRRATAAEQEGLHGACAFPVVSEQEVFGVFVFFSQRSQPHIDEDWLKVMLTLGRQIGQFIKRRQAEQQLQKQAENLKKTLRKLRKTQSQLIQSEKMSSLGQLVAGVAHEINNPVNFIHGNLIHVRQYAEDLLELVSIYQTQISNAPSAVKDYIEAIDLGFIQDDLPKILNSMEVGTDRIRGIVQSLRTFSRLDEAEMKVVDLHEGINSTLMILGNRLKPKSDYPEIQVIQEYGDLPQVECYPGQLNQVFMNILCNAIDALEEQSRFVNNALEVISSEEETNTPIIRIQTRVVNLQRVQITLSDNGPGMTKAVCKRLFDPFFTTKPVGKGTGMGMSISYQIITEKHQGSLQCISSPGQGAEFVIEIPVQQQA